jgi:transposase
MDVLRRSRILDVIDKAVPQHALSDVSTGECVAVILCGVYVGAHSLWRLRERLAPYDMATVMQDPTFDLNRFPEERLAKALDDLYAFGLDKLMTGLALETIRHYQVRTDILHFDTTTLSFYGAYEREDTWEGGDGLPPPRVTFGYSKAKRPDLKQVLFGCLSSADGGIPLLGKVLDGNTADSLAAAQFFARVRDLVSDPREVCLVADSKGWCSRTLAVVVPEGMRLLSRLPRSEQMHRTLMEKEWQPTLVIERPAKRRRDPPERYEIMGFDVERRYPVENVSADGATTTTTTLTVRARAIRVFSTALQKTKVATLGRVRSREERQAKAAIGDWQAVVYACDADAQRAAQRHVAQHQAVTHDLTATVVRHDGPAKRGRGRPRRTPEPALAAKEHWRVTYAIIPVETAVSRERLHEQSSFILIRTATPGWTCSDEQMIDLYRQQYRIEHGFAWLKSGAEINPMFIHTPHRIAGMGLIYCVGLMVWNIIQRTVRQQLKLTNSGLPYHRGKPSANITTRFLFELFPSVQTVVLTDDQGRQEKRLLGLERWQLAAVEALGCQKCAFLPVEARVRGISV